MEEIANQFLAASFCLIVLKYYVHLIKIVIYALQPHLLDFLYALRVLGLNYFNFNLKC